jgi:hypothetical protein
MYFSENPSFPPFAKGRFCVWGIAKEGNYPTNVRCDKLQPETKMLDSGSSPE